MSHFPAKAWVVDAVRGELSSAATPIGFERLRKWVGCMGDELRSAITYLMKECEVVHVKHRGYWTPSPLEQRARAKNRRAAR